MLVLYTNLFYFMLFLLYPHQDPNHHHPIDPNPKFHSTTTINSPSIRNKENIQYERTSRENILNSIVVPFPYTYSTQRMFKRTTYRKKYMTDCTYIRQRTK